MFNFKGEDFDVDRMSSMVRASAKNGSDLNFLVEDKSRGLKGVISLCTGESEGKIKIFCYDANEIECDEVLLIADFIERYVINDIIYYSDGKLLHASSLSEIRGI